MEVAEVKNFILIDEVLYREDTWEVRRRRSDEIPPPPVRVWHRECDDKIFLMGDHYDPLICCMCLKRAPEMVEFIYKMAI